MRTTCDKCRGDGKVKCRHCEGTGKVPMSPFVVKCLGAWREIFKYRRKLREGRWVFRGQANADWALHTSLERSCETFLGPMRNRKTAEEALMREFRRRLHHYLAAVPNRRDDLELLSLMQHHGAPTRLLDFSYPMLVACYFALERADSDCAVWAINAKWAAKTCVRYLRDRGLAAKSREVCYLKDPIAECGFRGFRKVFMEQDPPCRFVHPVNPFRLNERLTFQKGVFMCPGDVKATFEENLCAMDGHDSDQNVVKLVIPKQLRSQAIDDLCRLNVTRAVLFPGLDGFAQSLAVCPPKRLDLENRRSTTR
jgi:hypothetical protein